MEEEIPLVSAIMLAGRHPTSDIEAGIACFQAQTYPNKELIIVNNCKTQYAASNLVTRAQPDVFLVDTPREMSAGMCRNTGISAANGQILAQFDADYWHHPARLETQLKAMLHNDAHVCVLSETLSFSYASGHATYNRNIRQAILGTMVFIRPRDIDYPDITKNEELGLINRLSQAHFKTISLPEPTLCCKLRCPSGKRVKSVVSHDLAEEHLSVVTGLVETHGKAPVELAPPHQRSGGICSEL